MQDIQVFLGYTGISLSVCVQNTSCTFCQKAGDGAGGNKSYLLTTLFIPLQNDVFRGCTGIGLSVSLCTKY